LTQFQEEGKLGYWALHCNGTLQYHSRSCHNVDPEVMFSGWQWVKYWHIRCELDWYRMMKEYKVLVEGPLEPMTA